MENINTFQEGMNKDLAKSIFKAGTYINAENLSLITDVGLSTGTLRNIKGNQSFITIPSCSNVVQISSITPGTVAVSVTSGIGSFVVTATVNTLAELGAALQANPAFFNNSLAVAYTDTNIVIYGTLVNNILVNPIINVTAVGAVVNNSYVPFIGIPKIVGWGMLRDQIIIYTTENSDENPVNQPSQIWQLVYDKHTDIPVIKLIYNANLNLSLSHPIPNPGGFVGNFETDSIQKVYWTDNYNKPKIINIADPNAMALLPAELDINPNLAKGVATIYEVIDSGSVKTGIYQVSARFSVINGNLSTTIIPSNPITVVNEAESVNYKEYEARNTGETVSKSISARLYNLETKYDLVEPIVIYRETKNASPTIYILPAQPIPSSGIITFNYSGAETVVPLSLEEFLDEGIIFNTVKSVASKNNMLFFGNTKYSDFDVDFDCRAYRFSGKNASVSTRRKAVLRNQTSTQTITIDGTNLPTSSTWGIGTTEDAIQDINAQAPNSTENYLFQADGNTYGGQGPNVTYEFVRMYSINPTTGANSQYRTLLDDSNKAWGSFKAPYASVNKITKTINFNLDSPVQTGYTQAIQSSSNFGNSAGPFGSYTVRGYQRDEMYRFGIVFFSKKGEASYVHWIADIRMPKVYMPDPNGASAANRDLLAFPISSVDDPSRAVSNTNTTTGTASGTAYGNNLGIKFTVNNLNLIRDQISGYSIVRVKREDLDKTILGQGIFNPIYYSLSSGQIDCCTYWAAPSGDTWADQPIFGSTSDHFTSYGATLASPEFLFKSNPTFAANDQLDILQANKSIQSFTIQDSSGLPCANSTSLKFYVANEGAQAPKAATFNSNPLLNNATPINVTEAKSLRTNNTLSGLVSLYTNVNNWGWTGTATYAENCSSCPNRGTRDGVSRGVGGSRLYLGFSGTSLANTNTLDSIAIGSYGIGSTWATALYNDSIISYGGNISVNLVSGVYNASFNTITYTLAATPNPFVVGQIVSISQFDPVTSNDYNLSPAVIVAITSNQIIISPSVPPVNASATLIPGTSPQASFYNRSLSVYLANYRRPNVVQYGGTSFSARSYNEYISTGHVQLVDSAATSHTDMVFGGDTYITLFDYAEQLRNERLVYYSASSSQTKYSKTRNTLHLIPVECSFPVELRKNNSGTATDGHTARPRLAPNKSIAYADLPGSISTNNAGNPDTSEWFENFEINLDYIAENDVVKFFPRPYPYIDTTKFDVRVHRSQIKTNGELTDSWSIFKSSDYIDVDTSQGALNNLIIYQNTLVGFQDKGVVQLSVKERAISPDVSGSEMILGTGGILENYTYISKIIGSRHQFSFTTSHDAIFWFDMNTKNMYKMSGGAPVAITVSKGMASYLNNNLDGIIQNFDNPFLDKGITATYDFRYNEAIMTFKDTVKISNVSFTGAVATNPSTGVYTVVGVLLPSWAVQGAVVVSYINNGTTAYTGIISAVSGGNTMTITFDTNPTVVIGNSLTVYSYTKKSFTLAYNDFIDAYTSFYSFTPSVYINDQMSIFSPESGLNTLYRHDIGTHGFFYGTGPYKSTIKFIVNPYPTETKVFDNYQMTTEVIDLTTGANIIDDTFNRIRLYDDYQNSDFQSLPINSGKQTAKRKERSWNISNLRNRVLYYDRTSPTTVVLSPDIFSSLYLSSPLEKENMPVVTGAPFGVGERFRDKYLIVDLEYDNLTDKRLIFHTFKTDYRKSAR